MQPSMSDGIKPYQSVKPIQLLANRRARSWRATVLTACCGLLVALGLVVTTLAAYPTVAHAKMLTWIRATAPLTLDPHATRDATTLTFLRQVYEPLIQRDARAKLRPGLAKTWTRSGDGLTWRFHLRIGVLFHGGENLSADDVAYSINRARAPGSAFEKLLQPIESVTARGQYVVVIKTRTSDRRLALRLTHIAILNKAWAETAGLGQPAPALKAVPDGAAGDSAPSVGKANGTGPYQFRADTENLAQGAVLDQNEQWWRLTGTTLPIQSVRYLAIASADKRVEAFAKKTKELVFLQDVPVGHFTALRDMSHTHVETMPASNIVYFGTNPTPVRPAGQALASAETPLSNLAVRRAIQLAINRRGLARSTMGNQALPTGALVSPQSDAYPRALDVVAPAELRAARQLIAKTNYAKGFKTTLSCPETGILNVRALCEALAANLKEIGIIARIVFRPRLAHRALLARGAADVFVTTWSDVTLGGSDLIENLVIPAIYRSDTEHGRALSTLFAQHRADRSPTLRNEIFSVISKRIAKDATLLPLFLPTNVYATSEDVRIRPDIFDAPLLADVEVPQSTAERARALTASSGGQAGERAQ